MAKTKRQLVVGYSLNDLLYAHRWRTCKKSAESCSWLSGKAFVSELKGLEFDALCRSCACMYILKFMWEKNVFVCYALYVRPVFFFIKNKKK